MSQYSTPYRRFAPKTISHSVCKVYNQPHKIVYFLPNRQMTASLSVTTDAKTRSELDVDKSDTQVSDLLTQKHRKLTSSQTSEPKSDSDEASLNGERESDSNTTDDESRPGHHLGEKHGSSISQPQKAPQIVEDVIRKDIICTMFDLPNSTTFYPDFSCALSATFAMHGRMYPTSDVLCFYSNVFGRERKILIPYQFISTLQKTTTLMFQLAIRIEVQDDTTAKPKEYTFTSFWGNNRDCCFKLLTAIREQCRPSENREIAWGNSSGNEMSENEPEASAISEAQVDESTPNADNEIFNTHFESLRDESMQLVTDESFPIPPETFMKQFIYDNAPFGLNEFYRKIGYWDITLDAWTQSNDMVDGKTRSARYRVPVDAPLGPSTSLVDSVQCCKRPNRCVYIVETSTRVVDVPYGDHFSVIDRWTIMPIQLESGLGTHLQIELKVEFSKSTLWKSTICSKAAAENTKKFDQWVSYAKESIILPSSFSESNETKDDTTRVLVTRNRPSGKKTNALQQRERVATTKQNVNVKHSSAFWNAMYWVLVLLFAMMAIRLQVTLGRMERMLFQAREDLEHIRHELQEMKASDGRISTEHLS
uniref:Uncharacterized protein AlNc14C19G1978 n=1 Tax=Albugo laibachii Nc14 TaxID=890382 RepID=F0W507_9STRA|nr:conserved hypothetical protein [Albugo laibachii Nc14]|eukprot:CCA16198.1 conserved hypothetical protein [Albugo laibachii Nc14]